jgi:hypothetical protein
MPASDVLALAGIEDGQQNAKLYRRTVLFTVVEIAFALHPEALVVP